MASSDLRRFLTKGISTGDQNELAIEIKSFEFFFQNGSLEPLASSYGKVIVMELFVNRNWNIRNNTAHSFY